jgi:hypothetical protein
MASLLIIKGIQIITVTAILAEFVHHLQRFIEIAMVISILGILLPNPLSKMYYNP